MHVCLVGETLARDTELVVALGRHHVVTLAATTHELLPTVLVDLADVLVLETPVVPASLSDVVTAIRVRWPSLPVVLVNGGLSQLEVAEAFRRGIADYFAEPWDVALLAERVEVLGTHRSNARPRSAAMGEA